MEALRRANLEPPHFNDKRTSFLVTFHNHTLMNPEAIAWLNQYDDLPLNDRQRLALVYLRQHPAIGNPDYRRLNRVDMTLAGQELRGLVQTNLVEPEGFGRWTTYVLKVPAELPVPAAPPSDEMKILAYVREHGSISNAECRNILGVSVFRASRLLRKLMDDSKLQRKGGGRRVVYLLPETLFAPCLHELQTRR